jgi:hypothetical protein
MMSVVWQVVTSGPVSDPPPSENDVVAGWVGAVVLVALIIAVVFILRSFTKQLKKVEEADKAGVYGRDDEPAAGPEAPSDHEQPAP